MKKLTSWFVEKLVAIAIIALGVYLLVSFMDQTIPGFLAFYGFGFFVGAFMVLGGIYLLLRKTVVGKFISQKLDDFIKTLPLGR